MRLFTGIAVPYEVRRNIELLGQHLQPLADLNWSASANLHVTTKFIGEYPAAELADLKQALEAMPKPGAFRLAVSGLDWFPKPEQPRFFFAGVRAQAGLNDLAAATDEALAAVGVARWTTPYQPHLTLGRVRGAVDLTALRQAIAGLPSGEFGQFEVRKFHLYESKPGAGASVYSVLEDFSL